MKKVLFMMAIMLVCSGLFFSNPSIGAAADTIELKMVGSYPERHPLVMKGLKPWIASMDQKTNGRVKIFYYPENTLVPKKDNYDSTITGLIDILADSPLNARGKFPELELMSLPFFGSSSEANGLAFVEMLKKFPQIKARFNETKLLTLYASAITQLNTTDKLVKNLNDLKGLRIIGFNPLMINTIKALGANPIELLPPDIYMALQRNTADGALFPYAPLRAMKISDVSKYHTTINFVSGAFFLVMNKERFNSLPPDVQKTIEESSGENFTLAVGKVFDGASAFGVKWMKDNGHSFYSLPESEQQLWFEKMKPVVNAQLDRFVKTGVANAHEMYDELLRLGKELAK